VHRVDVANLPAPYASPSAMNFPRVVPKPDGAKLSLPPGWIYRTVVLEADFNLVAADNVAIVIQDDLLNTYQLAPGLKAETP
jgi:hypothetical protein